MKTRILQASIALACCAVIAAPAFARGSGGHGSGGHGSSGHGSGGHGSGGHGSGGHGGHGSAGHGSAGHGSGDHAGGRSSAANAAGSTTASPGTPATSPVGSRQPHGGQTVVGTAVPRLSGIATSFVGSSSYLPSRALPYYGPELAFRGLYYNPFWLSSYAYPAFGYGYRAYGYGGDPFEADVPTGGLRLIVEPRDGEVFVDGYYVGIVEDFDGRFHHLNLTQGPHHVEIQLPGYQPLLFDVAIAAHHTVTYRGTLLPTLPER